MSDLAKVSAVDLASDLVKVLKGRGASAADVVVQESRDFSVQVRLGRIEKLEESRSRGLGIRIIKDQRQAVAHTTDFSAASLKELADDLFSIVTVSDADDANGLAPKDLTGIYAGRLQLFDPEISRISTDRKVEMARACEDAGFAFDPRIKNSDGAAFFDHEGSFTLATSDGFHGTYEGTACGLQASLLAEENGIKQTDYWYSTKRFFSELMDPAAVGREAARRTTAKLGARKVESQKAALVVDPLVARRFVSMIFAAASGGAVYRKSTFLLNKLGQRIAPDFINIVDDAAMEDGPGSRPFDGEGLPSRRLELVRSGVLEEMPCDSYYARKLGRIPTGSASRGYGSLPHAGSSNLFLAPGTSTPAEILSSVKSGLYLTQLMGMGFNGVTGDLSQGAAGFWIENGKIAFPVQEITIAANFLDMLLGMEAAGNDLTFDNGATASPTLLIREVTIGGH